MFGGARSRLDAAEDWEIGATSRQFRSKRQLAGSGRPLAGSARYLPGSDRNIASGYRREHRAPRTPAGRRRPLRAVASSEEINSWSVYRQNLNSEFTDSALGSSEKSAPPPHQPGNFQLRQGGALKPRSQLGADIHSYLKHGLPRAFPPPPVDASSGYDSSDDDRETDVSRRLRRRRRTASQPELRSPGAIRLFGDSLLPDRRDKASSETDLLSESPTSDPSAVFSQRPERRRRRRGERGVSAGFSGGGRQPPMLNARLFPADQRVHPNQPHLQIRRLGCQRRGRSGWTPMLDEVSFEAYGGDLVGVLTTSEAEGTALLDVLGDCSSRGQLRISGELSLNGCAVSPSRLACRLAYVQKDHSLSGSLSVRQTLMFHAFLQQPGHVARGFNIKSKITALMDDLGLGQVKHTCVRELTASERCRLHVACQLCLETDVLLLDQPARHMDVFDTFFLVEYLRQWAARGRVVLLTLHPPTHDIFGLLSRVVLVSEQRVIYSGRRKDMLPYFVSIDYPCPSYKNPSDYYLDLVTLDSLSPEAQLESSQRVSELAEECEHQLQRLEDSGPPGLLPPRVRRAGGGVQLFGLAIRAVVYRFPYNLMELGWRLLVACVVSLTLGTIFYDIRGESRDQESVPDRVGFHYVMLSLAPWPSLLLAVSAIWRNKDVVARDIGDRLYSRIAHALAQILLSLPGAAVEALLLVGPAQKMAGSQPSDNTTTFWVYAGYMLVYLLCVRMLAAAAAFASSSRAAAAGWLTMLLLPLLVAAGWSVHPHQLSLWTTWIRWLSAPAWIYQRLAWNELAHVRALRCQRNPVVAQGQTILVQVECGLVQGRQALSFLAIDDERTPLLPLLVTGGTALLAALAALLAALLVTQRRSGNRIKREQMA